ncbi:MAG: Uma2 family endonuclease [Oscillochloridaceae bacterium umkhey_bin13]
MTLEVQQPAMHLQLTDDPNLIDLEPLQGLWSVKQYLQLTKQTKRLIEFTDGVIEILPMPTKAHQAMSRVLFLAFLAVMQRIGGDIFYAPLRLEVRSGKFREPDLLLVLKRDDPRAQNEYWTGADLVVEIVSPDRPQRDTEEKPLDYAEAGIPEYWIVNPLQSTITVLVLDGAAYREHGVYGRSQSAASALIADFSVSVDAVLDPA